MQYSINFPLDLSGTDAMTLMLLLCLSTSLPFSLARSKIWALMCVRCIHLRLPVTFTTRWTTRLNSWRLRKRVRCHRILSPTRFSAALEHVRFEILELWLLEPAWAHSSFLITSLRNYLLSQLRTSRITRRTTRTEFKKRKV